VKATYSVAATLLLAGVSFALTTSSSTAVVIGWSLVVGAVSSLFMKLIEAESVTAAGAESMLMAGAVGLVTWGLKWLANSTIAEWDDGVAVLVAVGVAWGLDALVATGSGARCFMCKRPIDGSPSFACPRCHQTICARPECWIARQFRCEGCREREVVLFPDDERWWRARVGSRLSNGTCSVCLRPANERDLRACGQCPWPMCTRCWDLQNGRCVKCDWIMPDLPEELRPFLNAFGGAADEHSDRAARRRP
jgi:hypothetical protein